MLTKEQVLETVKDRKTHNRESCRLLDNRDFSRLIGFFPASEWPTFGFALKDGAEMPAPKEWTEENIRAVLTSDLDFAFEKALDNRSISSGLMCEVVKMWLWVLEDELHVCEEYTQYGLPFLKKVAIKYGLPNPIGDDAGDEDKYASD